jgi:hypothetical protein
VARIQGLLPSSFLGDLPRTRTPPRQLGETVILQLASNFRRIPVLPSRKYTSSHDHIEKDKQAGPQTVVTESA